MYSQCVILKTFINRIFLAATCCAFPNALQLFLSSWAKQDALRLGAMCSDSFPHSFVAFNSRQLFNGNNLSYAVNDRDGLIEFNSSHFDWSYYGAQKLCFVRSI